MLRLYGPVAGFLVACLLAAAVGPLHVNAHAMTGVITTSGSRFMLNGQEIRLRGINMNNEQALGATIGSGRLSDLNVRAADFTRVASWGMNLVRFGLSFSWYQADRSAFFQAIDATVAGARSAGVYLIPIMFTTPGDCYEGYGTSCGIWSSASEQQSLRSFWQDFAQHYANEPAIAGYDLLNEPTPPGISQWYALAQSIRDAITSVDGNHFIVIEAGADSLFDSTLGPRVVYSVHGYAPLSMTTGATPGRYSYPGFAPDWDGSNRYWSYGTMTDPASAVYMGYRESLDWASQNNVPIFLGEFGAEPFGSGWIQYVSEQIDIAERWRAAWALHMYRSSSYGDFGVYYGPYSAPIGDSSVSVKQDLLDMLTAKLGSLQGPTGCTALPTGSTRGYNILTIFGGIYSFGTAAYHGNLIDHAYPGPAVGLAETPSGNGYVILTNFGGIYTFGDARYYGNLIDHGYPGRGVAVAMMPDGGGYAILADSGAVYTFGDARYFGNLIDHGYPGAPVGIAYTSTGCGYTILTDGGAIYTFGDANYYGNLIDHRDPGPAVSLGFTGDSGGYSILTGFGGIYSFGDAAYYGNLIDHRYPGPAVALAYTP